MNTQFILFVIPGSCEIFGYVFSFLLSPPHPRVQTPPPISSVYLNKLTGYGHTENFPFYFSGSVGFEKCGIYSLICSPYTQKSGRSATRQTGPLGKVRLPCFAFYCIYGVLNAFQNLTTEQRYLFAWYTVFTFLHRGVAGCKGWL